MGVITEEARRWADRGYPRFEMKVTATDIARFAHATGETNPIHFDRDTAMAAGYADVVAPTLFPYVVRMHASGPGPVGPVGVGRVAEGRRPTPPHPPGDGRGDIGRAR